MLLHADPSLAGMEDAVPGFGQAEGVAEGVAGTDPVIGVLFTLAVAALSVITLGVAYLSLVTFLDGQKEEEDRKSIDAPRRSPTPYGSGSAKPSAAAASGKKDPQAASTPKGFGTPKASGKKD